MDDPRNGPLHLPLQELHVLEDPPAQYLAVLPVRQPRSVRVGWKRWIELGALMVLLLLAIRLIVSLCYHVFGWGLADAAENWNPRSLPPMQQSPPWRTWRNRSTDVRLPRILQWTGEHARVSRPWAEAWPPNRGLSFGRIINVTSCATPSQAGVGSGQCIVSARRGFLSDSDAVVFHGGHFAITDLPNFRAVPQMWVFWAHNWPPKNETQLPHFLEAFPTLFNWTMSRREDSDVRIPSKVWRLNATVKKSGGPNKERKAVAWIASEREQSRNRTALQMLSVNASSGASNRVKLHILTRCGHGQCLSSADCMRRVADAYRFVLVELSPDCFESVYDVIYEAFKYDIVPVVLATPNVTLDVPPNSVIDSAELQQPGQLAAFLRVLMADASKYESFFAWKCKYHVGNLEELMCPLCVALLEQPMRPGDRLDLKEWHMRRASSPDEKPLYGVDDSFEEIEDEFEEAVE
ncbi:alpha-(1,3)-fucosyltransferase 7-like [Haemaphysalis longicornis]